MSGRRRKPFHTTLVYFEFNEELAFIEEGQAREIVAMHDARTWGELALTAPHLYASAVAALEEDYGRRPGDEEPFLFEDVPGACDGDWPEYPPFYMYRALPRHIITRFGAYEDSVLNGTMVTLNPEREAEMWPLSR